MTEKEVLERFDKYGNAIITLKKKLEEKTQENTNLESVKSALDIAISNLKKNKKLLKKKLIRLLSIWLKMLLSQWKKKSILQKEVMFRLLKS